MLGRRSHLRVKLQSKINWRIENTALMGEASIVNHSITGIKLNLDKSFDVQPESILIIEPINKEQITGIKKIKIKWFQKIVEEGKEILSVGGDFV